MVLENGILDEIITEISINTGTVFQAKITGGSMWPLIRNGSVLGIIPGSEKIKKGDIILFKSSSRLIAHRLLKMSPQNYITKGDALSFFDPPVKHEAIIGKAVYIEKDGKRLELDSGVWRLFNFLIACYSGVCGIIFMRMACKVPKRINHYSHRLANGANILFPMLIYLLTRRP